MKESYYLAATIGVILIGVIWGLGYLGEQARIRFGIEPTTDLFDIVLAFFLAIMVLSLALIEHYRKGMFKYKKKYEKAKKRI